MAMVSLKLACVVLMCIAMVGAPMAQAMTCGQITQNLTPCIPYLVQGGSASSGCCTGVKNVFGAATTTADRKAICNCLKTDASAISGIKDQYAQALPSQCNVNIPYKISLSTNCAAINF